MINERALSNGENRGTYQLFLPTQLEQGTTTATTLSKNSEGLHILEEIQLLLSSKPYCFEFAISHDVEAVLDVSGSKLIYIYCCLKKGSFVFELLRHKYDVYN